MVKKLIKALGAVLVLGTCYWFWQRLSGNPHGLVPLPYAMPVDNDTLVLDAPLLIAGDRTALRLGLFKETLALGLSAGLSKPIKIQSIAAEAEGLHRTLFKLNSLSKWPQVLIYQGGSEEFAESKFLTSQIPNIQKNFLRYQNDKLLTAMMVWPFLARLVYIPIKRVQLPLTPGPVPKTALNDIEYQQRLEITYRLYEIELNQLVQLARQHKTLLVLMTTPVNLDVAPRRSCDNASSSTTKKELKAIRELIRKQDYKAAYARSTQLKAGSVANADVFYLHGQVSYRNGLRKEALESLRLAAAFDCLGWRANEVTNSIIRKVARQERVTLFDFAQLVEKDWNQNVTFFDDIYPQDLYYERAMNYMAPVLKRILKL